MKINFKKMILKAITVSAVTMTICSTANASQATNKSNVFPVKYISENATAVKNQLSFGTCWLISALDTAQISIQDNNSKIGEFSPFQMLYFICHPAADKGSSSGNIYPLLAPGGSTASVTRAMACWIGPVSEDSLPDNLRYTKVDGLTPEQINRVAIPDKYRYSKDAAHLEQALTTQMMDKNSVKALIMEHGSVTTAYGDKLYYSILNEKECTYNDNSTDTNHAITVIGWDDNFSRNNFMVKPSKDGAWLAKNSWGDFNNSPYVWISYDCISLNKNEATTYIFGDSDNYKYNYQYDAPSLARAYTSSPTSSGTMANIFTAKSNVILRSVSFYTSNTDVNYEVNIYTSLREKNSPASGNKVSSVTGTAIYKGYYTQKLETPVILKKGDLFSVVINMKTNDTVNRKLKFEVEPTSTTKYGMTIQLTSNPGESFTSYDGISWTDRDTNGNLRIKAFLDDYSKSKDIVAYSCNIRKNKVESGKSLDSQDISVIAEYEDGSCQDISGMVSVKNSSFKSYGSKKVQLTYKGKTIYSSKIDVIPQNIKNLRISRIKDSLQLKWNSASNLCKVNIYGLKNFNGKKNLICSLNSSKTRVTLTPDRYKSYKYLFICQTTKKRYGSKFLSSSGTSIEIPH